MKIRNLLISLALSFSVSSAFATPASLLTFDKMENIKQNQKNVVKQVSLYVIISVSFIAGISIGYYYQYIKSTYSKPTQVVSVKKTDVKLAIDENNNLLVIKKTDGSYVVYEDSVGYLIFNLYAKNIWGQASKPVTPSN